MKYILFVVALVGCTSVSPNVIQVLGRDSSHRYFAVSCWSEKTECKQLAAQACFPYSWSQVSEVEGHKGHGRMDHMGTRYQSEQVEWDVLVRCDR